MTGITFMFLGTKPPDIGSGAAWYVPGVAAVSFCSGGALKSGGIRERSGSGVLWRPGETGGCLAEIEFCGDVSALDDPPKGRVKR